jgi:hypothetical protein
MSDDGAPRTTAPASSSLVKHITNNFATFEDYLDTQITPQDMFYLENQDLARHIVEMGFKGKNMLDRAQFEDLKKKNADAINSQTLANIRKNKKKKERMSSYGQNLTDFPLLKALAEREAAVRNGEKSVIVFIRDYDARGNEVSGYIDYGHRLKIEDFEEYFSRKKRFMPKTSDLSYWNWKTQTLRHNNSSTFTVIADTERGLLFKHRKDRKTIDVDPKATSPGDKSRREVIHTSEYLQVVLYEHINSRNL